MASTNPSLGRYAKQPTGMGRGGYNPPVYGGGDYYNQNDRNRDEGESIVFFKDLILFFCC
jgi:hypothetical protein